MANPFQRTSYELPRQDRYCWQERMQPDGSYPQQDFVERNCASYRGSPGGAFSLSAADSYMLDRLVTAEPWRFIRLTAPPSAPRRLSLPPQAPVVPRPLPAPAFSVLTRSSGRLAIPESVQDHHHNEKFLIFTWLTEVELTKIRLGYGGPFNRRLPGFMTSEKPLSLPQSRWESGERRVRLWLHEWDLHNSLRRQRGMEEEVHTKSHRNAVWLAEARRLSDVKKAADEARFAQMKSGEDVFANKDQRDEDAGEESKISEEE